MWWNESGLNTLIALVPSKKADVFGKWMKKAELVLFRQESKK